MDYLEIHISRKTAERLVYICLIIILLIISIFAYHKQPTVCEQVECDVEEANTNIVEDTQPTEIKTAEPVSEEQTISYVDIERLNFAPKELIIRNNTMVVFRNKEVATAHKLYEVKGLFFGPRMLPGDSFNYTFNQTGNYTVYSVIGKDQGKKVKIEVIS